MNQEKEKYINAYGALLSNKTKENLEKFYHYRYSNFSNIGKKPFYFLLETSLYNLEDFKNIYNTVKKLTDKDHEDIELLCKFDKNKSIEILNSNIETLILSFNIRVCIDIALDEETIKYNWTNILLNQLHCYVCFNFDNITNQKDISNFIKTASENGYFEAIPSYCGNERKPRGKFLNNETI